MPSSKKMINGKLRIIDYFINILTTIDNEDILLHWCSYIFQKKRKEKSLCGRARTISLGRDIFTFQLNRSNHFGSDHILLYEMWSEPEWWDHLKFDSKNFSTIIGNLWFGIFSIVIFQGFWCLRNCFHSKLIKSHN